MYIKKEEEKKIEEEGTYACSAGETVMQKCKKKSLIFCFFSSVFLADVSAIGDKRQGCGELSTSPANCLATRITDLRRSLLKP